MAGHRTGRSRRAETTTTPDRLGSAADAGSGRLSPIVGPTAPRTTIIPTGYERLLPPEVQLFVRARRRVVVRSARGRVLDLGGAEAHRTLWDARSVVDHARVLTGGDDPELAALARRGQRFDTVVSVFQLTAASDLGATLGRIATLLAEDGRVLFLEPGRLTGFPGTLQGLAAPPVGLLTGWRVDRDVPGELRRAGLSVTDIDRHRVPTLQWWLRMVAEGSAHHALPPDRTASIS